MGFKGYEVIGMLHFGHFIPGHPAPCWQFNRCTGITGNHKYLVARWLITNIQIEIDNNPTASFLTSVKLIIKIPIRFTFIHLNI